MVDTQLRTNKVTDDRILAAMGEIPRENFTPDDRSALAYIDEDIPIGAGRCMVEPMILARMIQTTEIDADDVVLDVASGSGYSAAVRCPGPGSPPRSSLSAPPPQQLPSSGCGNKSKGVVG